MTRMEFKQFLNLYKKVQDISQKVYGNDAVLFTISDGKVLANTKGEVLFNDITKGVIEELIPDEFIF